MRFTLLLLASVSLNAAPSRIAIIGGPQTLWPQIIAEFQQRYPTLAVEWELRASAEPRAVDLIFAYYPTAAELSGAPSLTAKRQLGFPVEFVAEAWKQPIDSAASTRAASYLDEGGVENGVRLLLYLYGLVNPSSPVAEPPVSGAKSGIYHPDAPEVFSGFDAYQRWSRSRHPDESAPRIVAIPFFSTWLRGHDLAVIDAMIRRVEAAGLIPVAAFGYPLETLTPLLTDQQQFQPEVVIALNVTLSSPKDADVYNAWGVPVLNGIVTRESAAEWAANTKGLPADRIATQLSLPERSGLIAPTLVATTETSVLGIKTGQPVAAGLTAIVDRAQRMLTLRKKPDSEKRVALIYYNNPTGKGNIGASYLQVFPSLRNILAALTDAGYSITGPLPDENELRRLIEASGRNLELWSEGEKRQAAESHSMTLWPVSEYRRYYDALPLEFRREVEATWGPPESGQLMTSDCPAGRCLLLPTLRLGNVLFAPQPLRTTFDQASDPGHERITPPPHQYVAFYLWLQHVWRADAVVHLGRHGTLEWLPGKQTALAPEDAPSILIGDLPNFNIYVMDGGGEAIQAKRRGQATLISHLTPMIWRTGGRADLETLHQSFHALMDGGDSLSPALVEEYEKVTRAEVTRLGLDRQLKLDMTGSLKAMAPTLHRFLHEIEDAPVPAGLPVFGQTPTEDQLRAAIGAYLFAAFPKAMHDEVDARIPNWSSRFLKGENARGEGEAFTDEVAAILTRASKDLPGWIQSLRESGAAEIHGLLSALNGAHVPSRLLGDPLRKPEALPTGGNLHAVDSARIPTEAAWRVGQKMAVEFLMTYEAAHHSPAKRVSLVLWYGETERHQGAMESMAMALLGVRPVWNQRGLVEELQLVPATELGRPRVDVVFTASGNYRDGFPDKLQLLDRAVRLAAQADDGVIASQDRKMAAELEAGGLNAEEAARLSQVRIFSAKPGAYGVGVQNLVEKSGGADTSKNIASLYSANMGFGYSNNQWGVASEAALQSNLRSIDAVQFSRSSNLYGSLDNDDTYQFVGGLRTAVEAASGRAPDVLLHNLRGEENAGRGSSLREWLAVELHSRQLNPTWIEEMRKSGYAGAREMSKEIEHLYGFQKTAPDHLDGNTWQAVMDVYVKDKHGLGLQKFFEEQNPHARQNVLARLLDVDRQSIHRFAAADRRLLLTEYARSIARDGASCNALDCGTPVLRTYVVNALRDSGLRQEAATLSRAFQKVLSKETPREDVARKKSPEPAPAPIPRLANLRQLGKYMITWVDRVQVNFTVKSVPWWGWVGLLLAYAGFAGFRARGNRTSKPLTLRLREPA
ncbi:MAG: cobaltochelatase subunit CobN [Bryobacteraceae bacterium]